MRRRRRPRPPPNGGAECGAFTAVYGLAWLAGSALIGARYDSSIHAAITYTVVLQAAATFRFLPLIRRQGTGASA